MKFVPKGPTPTFSKIVMIVTHSKLTDENDLWDDFEGILPKGP